MKERARFELAAKIIFFGTLEESFAIESAKKFTKLENQKHLLENVHKLLMCRKTKTTTTIYLTEGLFVFPSEIDLSCWREFKANCQRDIFLVILYKWIGKVSDKDLCEVLKISKGSLHSRCNHGLKSLGNFLMGNQVMQGI